MWDLSEVFYETAWSSVGHTVNIAHVGHDDSYYSPKTMWGHDPGQVCLLPWVELNQRLDPGKTALGNLSASTHTEATHTNTVE